MVLGIAPAAIIDRQLPFEYTITSRSTDVMAQPVQNINHLAFRSMFEREKLSGNNFNDWFRQLKLVLRVEKKMFVIEQPIPPAPAADSAANVLAEWNAIYDAYNEVACLMLGSMTPELHRQFENYSPYEMLQELKSMFEKQAGVERFDLIQTFHACKQEEGKPVAEYVLKMKGYLDQLERLGYVLPQDLSVGLILNGLTSDFAGFVRNYNMHNMGKTIGELHAMLIEYEKGLLKKVETPQLLKKKKQVGTASSSVYDAYNEVACLILGSMTPELHRQFENSSPYDMIKELKAMFEKQAGVERFDLIQTFHACKQEEGKPVAAYVLQMKGYVDQLERLGYVLPQDLTVGLILNGLTKDFAGFVRNYNMHNMGKTIGELHAMLIEYEKGLPKKAETPQVMMIKGGKIQKANKKSLKAKGKGKANGKGNDKQVYIPKPKNPKPSAKEHPAKDDTCHLCKELKQGALYLYVGNGVRAQVEAIGSFDLVLPNGLVICLDNCHYAPSITRGVVSVHRLVENGFVQCFTDFGISVSKNNVHYFNVIPSNGIYEIDMHDLVPNVNSIYNVSTKRAKHNLDFTYLWHCYLAHISKKHIEKLQQEGLLKSTDD
ncbi:hypothetical protein Tco_0966324 [Tanacetum coccineum]